MSLVVGHTRPKCVSLSNKISIRVKNVSKADLQTVADKYLVDPAVSGRTLIGPAQTGLEDLGWNTVRHS